MLTELSAEMLYIYYNHALLGNVVMEYSLNSNKSCARRRRPSMTLSMRRSQIMGDRESEDDWDLSASAAIMFIFHGS